MNCKTVTSNCFDRKVGELSKKYRSFAEDLQILKRELLENPKSGDDLGGNIRKVRMAIASKNRGKSGGARVITYNFWVDEANAKIYLLTVYDRGEQSSISGKEIRELKQANGLI